MPTQSYVRIRLSEKLVTKIKAQAEREQQKFNEQLRHLIELGLRVEELQETETSPDKKLEALVYQAVLENVMLTRALLRNAPYVPPEKLEVYLSKAKLNAAEKVKGFLGENSLITG